MHIMYPGIANSWIHGVSSASAAATLPAAPMPLEVAADGRRSPASAPAGAPGEAVGLRGKLRRFPSEIAGKIFEKMEFFLGNGEKCLEFPWEMADFEGR